MRFNYMSGLALFAAAAVFVIYLSTCANCAELEPQQTRREGFALPKLFEFEQFKQLFHKTYLSAVDELRRKKLFLARAFQVFLSAVSYKYRRSTSYLAINEMSDWSPEELKSRFLKAEVVQQWFEAAPESQEPAEQPSVGANDGQLNEVIINESDDVDTIEQKFEQLQPDDGQQIAEVAGELDAQVLTRAKRNTSPAVRHLSASDLVREPSSDAKKPPQDSAVVSNNPDYERPEVTSFGSFFSPDNLRPAAGMFKLVVEVAKGAIAPYEPPQKTDEYLPDTVFVDHRKSGCLSEPRNQGGCGSCYIFASIAYYEWAFCMATNQMATFSEQYVVDCGDRLWNNRGCEGGAFFGVHDFVASYGLELRKNYPYLAMQHSCPYEATTPAKSMGYLHVQSGGYEYVSLRGWEKALEEGPLVFGIRVHPTFQSYGGGVVTDERCDPDGAHEVVLVGHGREDNEEYWLIRNSFGRGWGEGGYYKLSKRAHKCIIASTGARFKNFQVPDKFNLRQGASKMVRARAVARSAYVANLQ